MKILYLLRRPSQQIDPALFHPSESVGNVNVVLLEEAQSSDLDCAPGAVFSIGQSDRYKKMSYDDLVEEIFKADRTIVI